MTRSASVTAAAIVAIVGSVLAILFTLLGLLGFLLISTQPGEAAVPHFVRVAGIVGLALFMCLGVLGFATGIGLLRKRNWARLSALIWAGALVFFAAFGFLAVVQMSLPAAPNLPADAMGFVRVLMASFYSAQLAVGVWWLILFNRQNVKAQFLAAASADSNAPKGPRSPLAVTIIGWFLVLGSPCALVLLVLPIRLPLLFFGRMLRGPLATAIFLVAALLQFAAGLGLLKLRPWGHSLALAMQLLWFVGGLASFLTPHFDENMAELLAEMQSWMPGVRLEAYAQNMRLSFVEGLAFAALLLGCLIYYRKPFLEAAQRRASRM